MYIIGIISLSISLALCPIVCVNMCQEKKDLYKRIDVLEERYIQDMESKK